MFNLNHLFSDIHLLKLFTKYVQHLKRINKITISFICKFAFVDSVSLVCREIKEHSDVT